ncbi:zinc-dependent alcohol dehydrogenase [Aeoliella sp.]|uniref:zinc-dependent alcohol dehydrogenase n=1 Tax=Aeoliella sp. TaxID=2795800 RepID=UPI003CCBB5D8
MKQVVMTAPGEIELREVDAPTPGPSEVLLRIERIGVCGSDVHVYHGRHPYTGYPVVQGHEYAATVEAVGDEVSGIAPGSKATAMPQLCCGQCGPCRRGDYHICDQLRVQGFQAPGCAQQWFVVPAHNVVKLPDHFTFEQGALVEPVAVAHHAVNKAAVGEGSRVVVAGAGPIGNLTAQVAQAQGARVLIVDLSDHRLEIAQACGLEHTANPKNADLPAAIAGAFGSDGFDVGFECVGVEPTLSALVENASKGGTIVVVGVFAEKPRVDVGLVQDRELRLLGSLMYKREDYEQAIDLIERSQISTKPLETTHFTLDQFADAYRYIEEHGERSMKVFIDVN